MKICKQITHLKKCTWNIDIDWVFFLYFKFFCFWTYCGIIVFRGGLTFVDFVGHPYLPIYEQTYTHNNIKLWNIKNKYIVIIYVEPFNYLNQRRLQT